MTSPALELEEKTAAISEGPTPLETRFDGMYTWLDKVRLRGRTLVYAMILSAAGGVALHEFLTSAPEQHHAEFLSKMKNGPIANQPCILVDKKTGKKIHAELCLTATELSAKINGQHYEGAKSARALVSSVHVRDGRIVIYLSMPQTSIELSEQDLCDAWTAATPGSPESLYLTCPYSLKFSSPLPKMIPDATTVGAEVIELRRVKTNRPAPIMQ